MENFYRKIRPDCEYHFYIETSSELTKRELGRLKWLLKETFEPENLRERSSFVSSKSVVEVGPRLNFETAFSTNAVSICHACGLTKVTRLERARRYPLPPVTNKSDFAAQHHDRMTERQYLTPLKTFETDIVPEKVYEIPLIEKGIKELEKVNREMGLGMDEWDINFYYNLFTKTIGRNPTNVECFQLSNNSEHSRHGFFHSKLIIDGKEVPRTLFQIVKAPLKANPSNSVGAFHDNASAIKGYRILTIIPVNPGTCSPFSEQQCFYHIIFTLETHNFPTGIAPFPGADTGLGGILRDEQTFGKGSTPTAGVTGYCTGNLNFPDYRIPGEQHGLSYPSNLASPLKILIEGSNGVSNYGNKFGQPVIQGFTRTFELILPNDERRAWLKPLLFAGGLGQVDDRHIKKDKPEKGMLIFQVGGPAYRIGMGGGSASSMIQGENIAELDFNAVQRGDPEMGNKLNRVVKACIEMGDKNPIRSIHDQGAGGPSNVLTEIVFPAGGKIDIRKIRVGDKTMSEVEIWCAEYQERNAFLIYADRLEEFLAICVREKVHCELLGKITGDGKIVVHDSRDGSTPVDLDLKQILGNMPQKTFHLKRIPQKLKPLKLPKNLTVKEALKSIFLLPSVGSKGFLVRKVDRSVTGLIAQQQCCGPLQLPVSDVAVVAQSHFGLTGGAIAIGEQPIKMLVDPKAGARMAVGEMLTNMVSAQISKLEDIKCSVNWMWAAKLPGEGAKLYDAAVAMSKLMIDIGIAADGGKDSLSMAVKTKDEMVKAPGQMVISGYVTVPDVTKVSTPDIKQPGKSKLMFLNIAPGKNRLGGSTLAQAHGQIGDESPDVDNPELLVRAFKTAQKININKDLFLACHDRSDGGLITTLSEMAMAGNCGIIINLPEKEEAIPQLFSEELGIALEYLPEHETAIKNTLKESDIPFTILGTTTKEKKVTIYHGNEIVLDIELSTLINWWEATSDRLEQEQMNPEIAKKQAQSHNHSGLKYNLTFEPEETSPDFLTQKNKPKVAIIREEGSNGDREMTSAFFAAGFEPWDVTMTDLLNGKTNLDRFRGIAFVGGFSYADVLDEAKGWAGIIKFNKELKNLFKRFFNRPDTFSLGVCNGCQLMALLGLIPWQEIPEIKQPRFIRNPSERFESHWGTVKISKSPSMMLKGMEGSILGIWSAHGGGHLHCPDPKILAEAMEKNLTPIAFVDNKGNPTEKYRFNPNGSKNGITAFCSEDGRHLAIMPHPERLFRIWQWSWIPEEWKHLKVSPWLKPFQNARKWCDENK